MHLSTICALALLFSVQSASQTAETPALPPQPVESEYFRVQRELAAWRELAGPTWRAHFDRETGWAQMVYGGARELAFVPAGDAELFAAARIAVDETRGLTGIDSRTLVDDSVVFLPLSLAGSNDKLAVQFRQEVAGVPVVHGYSTVLLDLDGRVLCVDHTGLPELAPDFDVAPTLSAGAAVDAAARAFVDETQLAPTRLVGPTLVIAQPRSPKLRAARLAWQVEAHWNDGRGAAEGWVYWIDARDGAVFARETAVHHDVSGTVSAKATPGLYPDASSNPETVQPMPHLTIISPQGNATTGVDGSFTIVGASAPVTGTFKFSGPFAFVNHQPGTDYSLSQSLTSSSGNAVTMNNTVNDLVTAQANAFLWIGKMREWTRSVNPSDATSDFLATANVNIADTCNAYYDGVSVNFYQPGGGCVNTSYSTVVLHEMGHWLNSRYLSGNGADGFGEGNADNFTTFLTDDPIVGQNFCGTNCNVRDANNTRQFCGDSNGGCYGEVHADGEVLMGACWKVRTRLKNALGSSLGVQTANTLFNAWMNAYNDGQIKTIVRTHWLVLDDDDGNVDNGTPNFAHIDGGFHDQGFPNYVIQSVSFANVTDLPDTQDPNGPYTVLADVFANTDPPIASAEILYRTGGGSFSSAPMSLVSGTQWSGAIPGLGSPVVVEYYVRATDGAAHSNVFPPDAPATLLRFKVGLETVFWSEGFESGTNGWTHGQVAVQDDWQLSSQFGQAGTAGESGDPVNAYAGGNVWGNDLGFGTWNGAYANNVGNWLRSPSIDLSGKTGCTLKFQRWLTVESGQYDQAIVKVNGTQVWVNDYALDTLDTAWTETEVDISSIADDNPSVQLEFALVSDVGLTFGGWNIDDVKIVALTASCAAPTATDPVAVAVCPGAAAGFSTTAGGTGPFSYQWKKDGSPIGGATASSYSIASVSAGDAGGYSCVVSNACGPYETAAAALTLNAPTQASGLANQNACPGGSASFSTTASGSGPFTYQWEKDGVPIGGATASSYTLNGVQASDAGVYSVVVAGACDSVEPSATLTIDSPTEATTPADQTVCPGGSAGFSTTASGSGPFTYQWKQDGSPIGGATASSYTVLDAQSSDAGAYSVVVTGACGFVEVGATLTVHAAVDATAPERATVCEGSPASFSTTASGTGPFTYQWKKDGLAIGGATASSYAIASAQAADAGTYSVLVSGACGSVELPATLAVDLAAGATTPASQTVCEGSPASFSTTASGTGPFTYQWKKDGLAIGGATASSYAIASAQAADAGTYSVLVSGACGSVEPSATLAVDLAAGATTPASQTVCEGSPASFSTTASGTGPFTYQWKKDGLAIGGATASSYAIASAQAADAGTYSVLVSGACGSVEPSATLAVDLAAGATTPASQTVCEGSPASFSTTASGTGPFTYQWKKDGLAIGGATASSYAIASAQAADAGTYSVLVSGACGSVELPATLAVDLAAGATTPASQTVCEGSPASFSTTASGTGPFTYQWKKDGLAIGGATASSYAIASAQAADAGTYSVLVSGACGSVEPSATLAVDLAAGATTPASQTVCEGSPASFSTTASGTGPFTYQWKKDGLAIGGATASSYAIASAQAADAGTYSVLVSGACGSVEPSATLAVDLAAGATTPASQTVCEGSPASFSTTASGTGPFTYQWKKDGLAIGGATASSYAIASAQAADAGTYSVLVSGACGSVEPSATLAVDLAAGATTPASQTVCEGSPASFSTTASGTGPFTYQWKKDGLAIGGATASSYAIASAQAADAGTYSVLVSGACGSVEPSATLAVDLAAGATTPDDQTVCPGGGASFSTSASGSGPFTYQWKKDGVDLAGETASTLALTGVQASDAGVYSVLVTGACGSLEPAATLAVSLPVSATEPADEIACAGETIVLSTIASGDGPFTYQWKKDGIALPGETASSLALASVGATDSGTYSVLVTGACGSVEPDAVLSVFGTTTTYCTSKQNSIGQFPSIASTGTPGATANDFVLTLSNALPNKFALAFWGTQPNGAPFNGGHLCAKPPLIRLSVKTTDASGFTSIAVPVDGTMVGVTRYYQWWSRDPSDPFTVSLSDGLSATFCD